MRGFATRPPSRPQTRDSIKQALCPKALADSQLEVMLKIVEPNVTDEQINKFKAYLGSRSVWLSLHLVACVAPSAKHATIGPSSVATPISCVWRIKTTPDALKNAYGQFYRSRALVTAAAQNKWIAAMAAAQWKEHDVYARQRVWRVRDCTHQGQFQGSRLAQVMFALCLEHTISHMDLLLARTGVEVAQNAEAPNPNSSKRYPGRMDGAPLTHSDRRARAGLRPCLGLSRQ